MVTPRDQLEYWKSRFDYLCLWHLWHRAGVIKLSHFLHKMLALATTKGRVPVTEQPRYNDKGGLQRRRLIKGACFTLSVPESARKWQRENQLSQDAKRMKPGTYRHKDGMEGG